MKNKLQILCKLMLFTLLWSLSVVAFSQNMASLPQSVPEDYPLKEIIQDQGYTSLKSVLLGIEAEHQVFFTYDASIVKGKRVKVKDWEKMEENKNLNQILDAFLSPLQLKFRKIKDNFYVIFPSEKTESPQKINYIQPRAKQEGYHGSIDRIKRLKLINFNPVMMLVKTVSGTVTDLSANAPLPGVNIVEKGTTNGTITDADGKYSISVTDENSVLIFSSVGYVSEEIPVGNQSEINVQLAEDIAALSEIVVVGYGTQKKSNITGAIASVSGEELSKVQVASFDQALQGKAAGVFVTSNSGQPGGGISIRIRGIGSINNSNLTV